MSGPFAVVLDGAAVPGGHREVYSLSTQPASSADLDLSFRSVVNAVGRPLNDYEDDWLDLLAAVYAADLLCLRGRNENNNRDIHLSLRARNPSAIQSIIPAVEEAFESLCQDRLTVSVEAWSTSPIARFPSQQQVPPTFDTVALLSGGLDSASTACQLLDSGASPCFVSSQTAGHVIVSQRRVLKQLATRFGASSTNAGFRVGVRKRSGQTVPRTREPSQRARTFLFIGVASLIAAARGLDTVTIGENGVMAINAPLTAGRFGPFSTHTAHPNVLARLGEIATRALRSPILVDNPSAFQTKTEVVQRMASLGMAGLIPETHSCWISRRDTHCGKCVPCLVRRFAVTSAGLPDTTYEIDVFSAPWDPTNPNIENLADYIAFAKTVRDSNDVELPLKFAEISVPGGPSARANAVAMYRRWIADVLNVLGSYPHLASIAA